jgi:anthranilate phosphoribosyltransferase
MKHAAPVRGELGIRTVFNALGPLTNPAGAKRQVVGVYDGALCPVLAQVLANLGAEHVMVVHGMAGLDEIATFGETVVAEAKNGVVETYTLTAETLGLPTAAHADVAPGADAAESATLLLGILEGRDTGHRYNIVLANAAAALVVAGVTETLPAGVAAARDLIRSGAAREKLEALRRCTQELEAVA